MEEYEVNEFVEETVCESADVETAWRLFAADKKKTFVAAVISPVARVTLGEKFGLAKGEDCIGKVAAVLRALGADAVVDAAAAQDVVTLLQVKALRAGATVFSLGCADVGVESSVPDVDEVSARLVKKYYRNQNAGKTVRVISVVPCEKAKRRVQGADVCLSVKELSDIIESTVVNLRLMGKEAWDLPLGVSSGAAYITKTLGGESEAVARCLLKDKSKFEICKLVYSGLYAKGNRKVAEISDGEKVWKFAVLDSVDEAQKLVEELQRGASVYDFVEVKPDGGCLCSLRMDDCADQERTAKLRALGLRKLDQARTAVSADVCPTSAALLRTWESMVSSGEAFEENEPIVDEVYEDEMAAVVEEILVEEILAEEIAEEPVVEEVAEEVAEEIAEEPVVEEVAEEIAEESVVEEVAEEIAEESVVEEVAEEIVEEPVAEEVAEEIAEEPVVEEVAEEIAEESVAEEVVEEIAEEPVVEEVVEEIAEEPVAEEPVAEEVVEEIVEDDELDGRSPYSRRLSTRERRKLRNKKKNKK